MKYDKTEFDKVNDEIATLDIPTIKAKLKELKIKQQDLTKLLGNVDKSSISIMLNPKRELTRYQKAMFFYLFEWLENKKII